MNHLNYQISSNAAFSSILLMSCLFMLNFSSCSKKSAQEVEVRAIDSIQTVMLPDSSRVLLNRGSSISYPAEFEEEERNVKLKGEAYFEVIKNSSKKFNVLAGNTKTTVLGTSFNIKAPEDSDEVVVTVIEGEVELTNTKKKEKIRLTKNDQVVFNKKKGSYSKQKVRGNKFKWWLKKLGQGIRKFFKNLGD